MINETTVNETDETLDQRIERITIPAALLDLLAEQLKPATPAAEPIDPAEELLARIQRIAKKGGYRYSVVAWAIMVTECPQGQRHLFSYPRLEQVPLGYVAL